MLTHYAGLGEAETACGRSCRPPTDDEHTTYLRRERSCGTKADRIAASLDHRNIDCAECIADMPVVPMCHCGAPALYGEHIVGDDRGHRLAPQWCAAHASDDCRCGQCGRLLTDASESFCERCLSADSADTGDGITEYADPAGCGGGCAA